MQSSVAARTFDNLVTQAGGKEAAAAVISSAVGHSISIGTLTKIKNGDAEVPLLWAWALMDATGNFAFDTYRAQQRSSDGTLSGGCILTLTGEASKEHGEALQASLRAEQSQSAEDWSQGAVEHREAADKHTEAAAVCEANAARVTKLNSNAKIRGHQ